ncbi:MAG: EAL domain-containing protein [Pseudomonadota bacterium]
MDSLIHQATSQDVEVCGVFRNGQLSARMAQICTLNGWKIKYWHTGNPTDANLPNNQADIILVDHPYIQQCLSSGHPSVTQAAALCVHIADVERQPWGLDNPPDMQSADEVLQLHAELSDEELLHRITTALNVARFDQKFFHQENAEPITQLPAHEELLAYMERYRGSPTGLILVQLDHANHLYSNMDPVSKTDLLGALSEQLKRILPTEVHLGIFDAACFIVWYPNATVSETQAQAQQLKQSFRQASFKQGSLQFTCSLGYSTTPLLGSPKQLWQQAWAGMQAAASEGGDQCVGFSAEQNMHERIPTALSRDEFSLVLQPQWDTEENRLVGVESLLRWQGMDIGNLAPDQFIPVAERTGQMARVGDWVLERAACEATTWLEHLLEPIHLGINVSPQQFHNDAILQQVTRLANDRWLDPGILELELSHENLLQVVQDHRATLYQLRDLGVRIAIDNLGTRVVDTNSLLRCPADTLKLDRSMIAGLTDNPDSQRLVTQICQMANKYSLRVVAVGVESNADKLLLQELGCSVMQGFLISAPVPLERFQNFLIDNHLSEQFSDQFPDDQTA